MTRHGRASSNALSKRWQTVWAFGMLDPVGTSQTARAPDMAITIPSPASNGMNERKRLSRWWGDEVSTDSVRAGVKAEGQCAGRLELLGLSRKVNRTENPCRHATLCVVGPTAD